jgi:hypothetical protein
MLRARVRLLLSLLLVLLAARPGAALIIDIDATANNFGTPVSVFLAAGTYTVAPIGTAGGGLYDAWNPWGLSTCSDSNGCAQTIPTTVLGWKNSYDVLSDDITAVSVTGLPLSPIGADPTDPSVLQDYWLSNGTETDRYHVDDATVYPTAGDALTHAESSVFTLSTSGFVGFAIRDNGLNDNLGGMSLSVVHTPEPSTAALLALGLAAFALRRRAR